MEELLNSSKDLDSLKTDLIAGTDGVFMGLSMNGILFSFIFSMIGIAYFRLGKKNQNMNMMFLGILLMVYPYFVTNTLYIFLIGVFLSFLPLLLKSFFSR